jgi:hypothetical protein
LEERKLATFFVRFIDDVGFSFLPLLHFLFLLHILFIVCSINEELAACPLLSAIKVAIYRNVCTLSCITEVRNPLIYVAQTTEIIYQLHEPERYRNFCPEPYNLLTDLPSTVHSCSRHGVIAAWNSQAALYRFRKHILCWQQGCGVGVGRNFSGVGVVINVPTQTPTSI